MAKDPSFYKDCAAILGPNQPSITQPDPTASGNQFAASGPQQQSKAKTERKESAPDAKQPEGNAPDQLKGPLDEVKKKLDKDELRKRAIERLREALEKGNEDVEKLQPAPGRPASSCPHPSRPCAPYRLSSPAPSILILTFPGRLPGSAGRASGTATAAMLSTKPPRDDRRRHASLPLRRRSCPRWSCSCRTTPTRAWS